MKAARPRTPIWKKLLLLSFTLLFVLGALELFLRYKYGPSMAMHADKKFAYIRSSNPTLVYEMRPDHEARFPGLEAVLRTNSSGFRDYEFTKKPEGRYRIVAIGDSVTVGWDMEPPDTYPKMLERRLKEEAGLDADVFNMGCSGYNTLQEVEVIKTKALQHEPDLILIAYVLNDKTFWGQDAGATRYFLHSGCMVWDQVKLRWNRMKYKIGDDLVTVAFRELAAFMKGRGIPILVVVFPYLEEDDGEYPHRDHHDQVAALAKEHGFLHLDLLDLYRKAGLETLKAKDHDIVHPGVKGHRIAADAIYDYIRTRP